MSEMLEAWLMASVKAALKNFMVELGLGYWLGEFCGVCGSKQKIVWWADTELWLAVNRVRSGTLCPYCFDREAMKIGYFLRWSPDEKLEDWDRNEVENEG